MRSDSRASSKRSMPKPKRSKKSGSKKLAEFRDKKVTPGESPDDYRNKVEAERKSTNDVSPLAQKGAQRESSEAELYDGLVFSFPAQQERSAAELRREIVQSQNKQSTSYIPFLKSNEQQLREAEAKEQEAAMNLGRFDNTAAGYEKKVDTTLDPLTGSNSAALRFAGGFSEAIAYTPTAIPRIATGIVRNPAATIQGVVQGTAESVIRDPARGAGQLAAMVAGPKMAKGGLKGIKLTAEASKPIASGGSRLIASAADGGLGTLKKAGSNPNFDVVGLGRDVTGLGKRAIEPVSQKANTVLFDAELARLRGTGKARSAAGTLETSTKKGLKPFEEGMNKIQVKLDLQLVLWKLQLRKD